MTRRVEFFDTTLRDGEQAPGAKLDGKEKLALAKQLERLGVDVIEAGFPASSPGDLEAIQHICAEVPRPVITVLARACKEDVELGARAIAHAKRGRINVFLGTSDIHISKKFRSTRKDNLKRGAEMVRYARSFGFPVEYTMEDATRSDGSYVRETIDAVVEAGAEVINVADTVGVALPHIYAGMIRTIVQHAPAYVKTSAHCHNDLGLATANSLAAVEAGATQIECTINGLGERAGNAALEEIVMALQFHRDHYGVEHGIETGLLLETSRMAAELCGIQPQPNKAVVGDNAFRHSSGVHQDGLVKARETYEFTDPATIGGASNAFVLTARSGRAGLALAARRLGWPLGGDQVERLYPRFVELADQQKHVDDAALGALIEQHLGSEVEKGALNA